MARKVCIVGTAHPFRGGMADYNERLARTFQQNGDDVIIVNFTTQYPSVLFPGKTQYTSSQPPEGLIIHRKLSSVNPLSWVRTGLYIKKMRPDIVLINYWLPLMAPAFGTVARIIRKNKHTRVLSVVHNMLPHEKRIGDRLLSRYFIHAVDGFLSMSQKVIADIRSFSSDKPLEFNPHPLYDHYGKSISRESALKKLNLNTSNRYLLFFGFIRNYKGLDLLIKSLSIASPEIPNLHLIVAGEFYAKAQMYYDLIEEYKVQDRVHLFTDFIPNEQVPVMFSAADLVVQPYKSATQSGVTQIGYHFEKPMIVTDVGGLAELIPHERVGFVVKPEPKEIAHGIKRFFKENREQEFIENIKKEKQKFSWEKLLNKLNKLDNQVLQNKSKKIVDA